MLLLIVLVFFAVFTLCALLLVAGRSGVSKQTEQTMTVLHAALATGNRVAVDQIVDIRKEELLSAVPLLNRWLLRLEITRWPAPSALIRPSFLTSTWTSWPGRASS